jgi:uncharacterized protein (TIGR02246 family)
VCAPEGSREERPEAATEAPDSDEVTGAEMTAAASAGAEPRDIDAFRGLYKKLVGAANRGDVETYISCYTDDGVMMPPHAQPVVGRAALDAYMTDWLGTWQLEGHVAFMDDQRVGGSVAFCRYRTEGRYLPRSGGDPVPYTHKYIDTLIRQPDGSWLIAVHMWSSNVAGSNVWDKEAPK